MLVAKSSKERRARAALLDRINPLDLGYGRFMQTDPLGYDDGLNWYNYTGGDPINMTDPTGLRAGCVDVPGSRIQDCSARAAAQEFVSSTFGDDAGPSSIDAVANYLTGAGSLGDVKAHFNEAAKGRSLYERATYTDAVTKDIVVTARVSISNDSRWINTGDGYVINPNHVNRWYDVGLTGVLPAAAAVGLVAAVSLPALGPAGAVLGRARYRGSLGAGVLNRGNTRFGWSWNQNGWAGSRNYLGPHGGKPNTPNHWHWTPIPGKRN